MQESIQKRTLRSLVVTLLFIWLGCVVFVVLEQVAGLLTYRDFDVDPLVRLHFITLFYWLPWLLFAPLIAMLSRRMPLHADNWRIPLAAHLLLLLGIVLAHSLGFSYVYHYSNYVSPLMASYEPWQHSGHFLIADDGLLFIVAFYAGVAASLNIRNFLDIVRQKELDESRLNASLAELRLQALRMQINPHFLFNALNAVATLVRKRDTDRAAETIGRLSSLFRRALATSGEQWVPLEDELDFVRQYIDIAKIRFGDRLAVTECCDPTARNIAVPAMFLQPLVENAVTHGLAPKSGSCELRLDCRAEHNWLRIDLHDNGVGGLFYADPTFVEGIGLANVRARLEQMYGGRHRFKLDSAPGEGTHIAIELPLVATPRVIAV